jgi:two-component system, NarL family, response regulator NreC
VGKLRILLAEDHETVREGLKMIVNAQADMEVVAEAADGRSAIAQAQDTQPDIVVMDVSMPLLNGLKATETLQQCCPQVKVLILTRHAHGGYLQQLLRAGAAGYVLKQSRPAELLKAIRIVGSGSNYLDPLLAGTVVRDYGGRQQAASSTDAARTLTGREAEVLRLMAGGYSNKEIAAQLELSVKTIETHKGNAMQKLGMRSRIDLVRFALLQGWLQDT